jgi:hypothetical protein
MRRDLRQASFAEGLVNQPYVGLVRNACHLHLLCTAINLKRALALAG